VLVKSGHIINVVDSHTAGEPTRIVVSGLPAIQGKTVAEKRDAFRAKFDYLRKALLWEPRGHRDMFGAVLVPPEDPRAQIGSFFLDPGGYLDMCGHGSIGLVTVCFHMGMLSRKSRQKSWFLETPAGLVRFQPNFDRRGVASVSIQNVPSFVCRSGLTFDLPGYGSIKGDVAYGGNFFLLVDATQLGLGISPREINRLIDLGLALRHRANEQVQVSHPHSAERKSIQLVEFYVPLDGKQANARNVVILGDGQVDRSPCGTGTCAKMALLHAEGRLGLNADYIQESILGTRFSGRLLSETKVGEFPAVCPEITGSAWITGFNQLVVDPKDPLKGGFLLS
jgi:proline racemase/trans-L-3-hydroxyproline dehydratase